MSVQVRTIDLGSITFRFSIGLIYLFLLSPMVVIFIVSFTETQYVVFPPRGLTLRWYIECLGLDEFLSSFKISVYLAFFVSIISTTLGTMISLAVVRYPIPGKNTINTFFLSPLMFPSIVLGIALLKFINILEFVPMFLGLALGHIVITMPFAIRSVSAILYGFDRSLEEAAMDLGAGRFKTFYKITLPLIKPGITNSLLFSFLVSFGDLTVSLFISGPLFKTLPVQIYSFINLSSVDPTIAAISSLIIIVESILFGLLFKVLGSTDIW